MASTRDIAADAEATPLAPLDAPVDTGALSTLQAAAFFSSFDRLAITPMLVAISVEFGASLAAAAVAATVYFIAYGVMQPVWGLASDRFGRVHVIRFTLAGAVIASAAAAAAPSLAALVVARGLAGACFSGVIPAGLVYVGDTVPTTHRHAALADLMSATSAGMAASTVVSGAAVWVADWRLVFVLSGLGAAGVALRARRLSEPPAVGRVFGWWRAVRLLRRPWMIVVVVLAVVEGAVVVGFFTFLAPAVEHAGVGAAVAGVVVGLFGLAVVASTRVVKSLVARWSSGALISAGAAQIAVGYLCAAVHPRPAGIAFAALLLGAGFAFIHSTLQHWATEVAPDMRGTAVSLFAAGLFVGAAIATTFGASLAEDGEFSVLFAIATAIAVPLGAAATVLRRRYEHEHPPGGHVLP